MKTAVKTVFCEKCAKKFLTAKPARARMASLIDETATVRPASVSNQAKKRLTRNQSCAKLASLIQATQQHRQHRKSSKKVLDRQKQVCETGLTERNATTGSKIKQKCLTAEAKRVKLAALNEQTNPGTAQRASLKEHYHDCNHQKRPG